MDQVTINLIKKIEKNQFLLSIIIRIGYLLFTWPLFKEMNVLEYEQTRIFGIEIFNFIFFLMFFFGLFSLFLIGDIYESRKNLSLQMKKFNIKYYKNYVPGLIFLLSIGLLWVDYFFEYFFIVYSIFSIIAIEIYIIREKKALQSFKRITN